MWKVQAGGSTRRVPYLLLDLLFLLGGLLQLSLQVTDLVQVPGRLVHSHMAVSPSVIAHSKLIQTNLNPTLLKLIGFIRFKTIKLFLSSPQHASF